MFNLIKGGVDVISNVVNKVFPDKTEIEKQQLQKDLQILTTSLEEKKIDSQLAIGQIETNKIEAASEKIFKSGWRPFIGWTCGVCLATCYIPKYLISAWLWYTQCIKLGEILAYPMHDDNLFQLIFALLGLSTLHSADKVVKLILNKNK